MDIDFERPGKSIHRPVVGTDSVAVPAGHVCVINNGPGPRVLVVAGVHGDEYEAQLALHRLIARIEPDAVRGRLVIIPEANFPASSHGTRCSPSHGLNMNRTFPGDRAGSPTQRLAAFLIHNVLPWADLLIDVHSGGPTYKGDPIVFGFSNAASKMPECELVGIMEAFGLPYVTHQDITSSTLVGTAAAAGIAAIELEGAGTTLIEGGNVDVFLQGLLRGLAHIGVLAGEPPTTGSVSQHLDVRAENMFETPVEGLLERRVSMGQAVAAGDLVAVIHPFAGFHGEPHRIEARAPGIVISQRSLLRVVSGDCLGNTGTPR
jgi:predicted deacylase